MHVRKLRESFPDGASRVPSTRIMEANNVLPALLFFETVGGICKRVGPFNPRPSTKDVHQSVKGTNSIFFILENLSPRPPGVSNDAELRVGVEGKL